MAGLLLILTITFVVFIGTFSYKIGVRFLLKKNPNFDKNNLLFKIVFGSSISIVCCILFWFFFLILLDFSDFRRY